MTILVTGGAGFIGANRCRSHQGGPGLAAADKLRERPCADRALVPGQPVLG